MQASAQVDRTEASAQTAFEQLLEEEEQAAARAAAKKAKKLKQKAKKQQDQQLQSPSENKASSVDGISQAPDKPVQHYSEADEMSDGMLPTRDLLLGSSLPDAEGSKNIHALFSADDNAKNTAALLDAVSPTGHDRIASSLSALTVCDSSQGEELEAMQEEAGLDTDNHRLQNIFCCPITKVIPVLVYIYHARQPTFCCCFTQGYSLLSSFESLHQYILVCTAVNTHHKYTL